MTEPVKQGLSYKARWDIKKRAKFSCIAWNDCKKVNDKKDNSASWWTICRSDIKIRY